MRVTKTIAVNLSGINEQPFRKLQLCRTNRTDGLNVRRINQTPKVIFIVRAVESQAETRSNSCYHCGDASGSQIAWIPGLQFGANVELVDWGRWVLFVRIQRLTINNQRGNWRNVNQRAITCLKQLLAAGLLPVSFKYSCHENELQLRSAEAAEAAPFSSVSLGIGTGIGLGAKAPVFGSPVDVGLTCLPSSFFLYLFRHFSLQKSLTAEFLVIWKGGPCITSLHCAQAPLRNSNRHASEQKVLLPLFRGSTYGSFPA